MALIEVFHVVASDILIDPDETTDIPQGCLVTLTDEGLVTISAAAVGGEPNMIGIAGDSRSTGVTSYTPESGSALSEDPATSLTGALVIGSLGGARRFTQNRIPDNYNEVLASGKMTVYHGGGEFWTDQYLTADTAVPVYTPGSFLYPSDVEGTAGQFTDVAVGTNTAHNIVGITITAPTDYPSGVPGSGVNATGFTALPEGGNSLTFGSFLHVALRI